MPILVFLAAVTVLLAAVPLIVRPPMGRVASWLRARQPAAPESAVIAARAALQHINSASSAVIVLFAIAFVISDLDFYLSMVGYAVAVIVGAATRLGGSEQRRAGLTPASSTPGLGTKRVLRLSLGLAAITTVLSLVMLAVFTARAGNTATYLNLMNPFGLPDITTRALIITASVSAFLVLLAVVGWGMIGRRQSAAGTSPEVDGMIRALCFRRIAFASIGGQAVLLGAILPAVQIATLEVARRSSAVNENLVTITSVVGLALIVIGIAACAYAVLQPVWLQPKRSTRYRRTEHSDAGTSHPEAPLPAGTWNGSNQ
ncbi:hypothetical protein [Cryobacterium sp. CG_9.6]|uniref:hypothetical protein n=1 Tax=Cryobacterium sp. CG_9.6 TaxID=2760710 RepID=UPI002473F3CC|nr:hypothetical protein [Cryobacterium sp. CG_9.6]MDH6237126.1 hypothetical protein [Cryobacterium sp. CG_9.6]